MAIIAILAGMLLPALSKAREKARTIGCVNNEKSMTLGILMYADDYNGICLSYSGYNESSIGNWKQGISKYLNIDPAKYNSSAVFRCPSMVIPYDWSIGKALDYCGYGINKNMAYPQGADTNRYIKRLKKPVRRVLIADQKHTTNNPQGYMAHGIDGTSSDIFQRHGVDCANYGFADGHAKTARWAYSDSSDLPEGLMANRGWGTYAWGWHCMN